MYEVSFTATLIKQVISETVIRDYFAISGSGRKLLTMCKNGFTKFLWLDC